MRHQLPSLAPMEVPTISALRMRTMPHIFPPDSHNSNPHSWSGPQRAPARPLNPHKQTPNQHDNRQLIKVICDGVTSRNSSNRSSSSDGGGWDAEPLPAAGAAVGVTASQPPAAATAPGRLWQMLVTGWTAAASFIATPPLSKACPVPAGQQQQQAALSASLLTAADSVWQAN